MLFFLVADQISNNDKHGPTYKTDLWFIKSQFGKLSLGPEHILFNIWWNICKEIQILFDICCLDKTMKLISTSVDYIKQRGS